LGYAYTRDAYGNVDYWEFSSAEFWGETPEGLWTLTMQDLWAQDQATWNSFEFTGYAEAEGTMIPEPASFLLLGIGVFGGFGLFTRKK